MKKKVSCVWVVISCDGFESSKPSFKQAEEVAKDLVECDSKTDVMILEVVQAWNVEYPEEPLPETFVTDLGSL